MKNTLRQVFKRARLIVVGTALSGMAQDPVTQAQVTDFYTFSQSSGSFNSLFQGTSIASGNSMDDQVSGPIAIPTFYFNNVGYDELYISVNGFITFGAPPSANNYSPLSSNEGYAGAIAAFGSDLTARQGGGARDVRYHVDGNIIIIEWRQVRRKNLNESFFFQIRMNTLTSLFQLVYGPINAGPASQTTLFPEVGIRGPSNNPSEVLNRRVGTGNENWDTSLPGGQIDNKMRFTSSNPAKFWSSGLTYTYVPQCPAPVGAPCNDGDPTTGNDTMFEDCMCIGEPLDCEDVPGGTAGPGTPCDDGNPNTAFDSYGEDCICAGVACTEDVTLDIRTDNNGSQTSWEILGQENSMVACSGGNYPNNSVITTNCCLPVGCYVLRVYDSAGDGMAAGNTTGGYTLRLPGANGDRIIDNRNNFNGDFDGSVSAINNGRGFCVPMGSDRLIFTSCDKTFWKNNEFIVASLNPAVSAEWVPNAPNSQQDSDTGYEFWFFDPNGSYGFRWFRSHNTSHGYGSGPARAAHLRINNWLAAYHLPEGVLLNVRVRSRVNGVNSEWGPACRFMLDPQAAECPPTKLMDIPYNQFLSCGQYREWTFNSFAHAVPVSGATQYQFRFRQPAEGYEVIRTESSYFVRIFWENPNGTTPPLTDGSPYQVDVRARVNGQWCDWGEVCILNIGTPPGIQGGTQNSITSTASNEFNMWPNPNRGDQLHISLPLHRLGETDVETVSVHLFDLYGKRVTSRTIAVQDRMINTVIDLQGELAAGIYMVNLTAGVNVYTQRLIVH